MKTQLNSRLRVALFVTLIAGAILGSAIYFYRSYYQATIQITNLSGKLVNLQIEWKSTSHEVLKHQETQLKDQEQEAFSYLPPKNLGMDYHDFVVLDAQFQFEGSTEKHFILSKKVYRGEVLGRLISEDGSSPIDINVSIPPIMDRK